MTIERRKAWDGSELAANSGKATDVPDDALHNSAVVGSSNAPAESERPPKGGAGSGHDEWAAYAKKIGLNVDEDATRDEIIAAVESAED